jgi:hypothetical protein
MRRRSSRTRRSSRSTRAPLAALVRVVLLGGVFACSPPEGAAVDGRARSPIEIGQMGSIFDLATSLAAERTDAARWKEGASLATGALLAPFVDADGAPLLARNGARTRGTCGVTFISPSYAVTAAHCVDPANADLGALVVEMYRPTPVVADSLPAAATLAGTFPEYTHGRLGAGGGYFVDRYACALVSRCSDAYGGPLQCDSSTPGADTALVRCENAPGRTYGFVDVATTDDPSAALFMPWKHEIYDVPDGAPSDDRWIHYVAYTDPPDNYHYLGADRSGAEQNQLLPLVSVDFPDGTPHHELAATEPLVSTDLWGCHGTSGSGVLQAAEDGEWRLLGPASLGNPEHDEFLCDHIPSLDGTCRDPGCLGVSYVALGTTRGMAADNADALRADCDPFAYGAAAFFPLRACWLDRLADDPARPDDGAVVAHLSPPSTVSPLDPRREPVIALAAGESVAVAGFSIASRRRYRLGLVAWADAPGCTGTTCAELTVNVDGKDVVARPLGASSQSIALAATFVADGAGPAPIRIGAGAAPAALPAARLELAQLTLRLEEAANTFDSMTERLEAALEDLGTPGSDAQPMRFLGDGRLGFAAWLLPNERMLLTRQAIAPGRAWSVAFTASGVARASGMVVVASPSAGELTCGFLDERGAVIAAVDCTSGNARIDDRASTAAAAALYIQTSPGSGPIAIDDVTLVSDAETARGVPGSGWTTCAGCAVPVGDPDPLAVVSRATPEGPPAIGAVPAPPVARIVDPAFTR